MKNLCLAAALLVAFAALPLRRSVGAAPPVDGLWDAVVVAGGAEVPFRFQIATKGSEAQGFFFEGDRQIGSTSGTYCRRRAEARVRLPEHDAGAQAHRRRSGRHLSEQSRRLAAPERAHAPVHAGGGRGREHAGAGRQLGDAAQRGRSQRPARHAHLARVPAPVGRRAVGHHSSRRRRRRDAGGALAERQAGAQPFRGRAAEPVRGDAQRRTARSPSR